MVNKKCGGIITNREDFVTKKKSWKRGDIRTSFSVLSYNDISKELKTKTYCRKFLPSQ